MTKDFKINNFDLLRLFAAYEVLLLHSFHHLEIPYPAFFKIMENFPGVAMFFVMSGFLISASLERNQGLKVYFKNRALRIFPALWVCIFLTVITIYLFSGISFINSESIPWLLTQLLGFIYTPNFLSGFGFGSYNGSLWTIPLELQFYVVLPIVYYILSKFAKTESGRSAILIIIFSIFLVGTFFIRSEPGYFTDAETTTQKLLRYTFIPNIFLFFFGNVLQRLKIYKSDFIHGKGLVWVALFIFFAYVSPPTIFFELAKLLFLGVTTISLAYTLPTLSSKLLKGQDISYGIYIYHGLVLGVIVELNLLKNSNYVLVIILITTILAILSWVYVEKYFLRRKNKSESSNASIKVQNQPSFNQY